MASLESLMDAEPSPDIVNLDGIEWLAQRILEVQNTDYGTGLDQYNTSRKTFLWEFSVGKTDVSCAIPVSFMPYPSVSITTTETIARSYEGDQPIIMIQKDSFKNQDMFRRRPDYVYKSNPTIYNVGSTGLKASATGIHPIEQIRFGAKRSELLNPVRRLRTHRAFDRYVDDEYLSPRNLFVARWKQLDYFMETALRGDATKITFEESGKHN